MSRKSRAHTRRKTAEDVELNIAPFMNLMIVLVPVLLLSMVFTHVRIHDVQLPELSQRMSESPDEQKNLELMVNKKGFFLFYPAGNLLKEFPATEENGMPYIELRDYLRQVKSTFQEKETEKEDITLLAAPDTDYQTLILTLDSVKFIPEQVGEEVVMAALFPEVSLGSAPAEK